MTMAPIHPSPNPSTIPQGTTRTLHPQPTARGPPAHKVHPQPTARGPPARKVRTAPRLQTRGVVATKFGTAAGFAHGSFTNQCLRMYKHAVSSIDVLLNLSCRILTCFSISASNAYAGLANRISQRNEEEGVARALPSESGLGLMIPKILPTPRRGSINGSCPEQRTTLPSWRRHPRRIQ